MAIVPPTINPPRQREGLFDRLGRMSAFKGQQQANEMNRMNIDAARQGQDIAARIQQIRASDLPPMQQYEAIKQLDANQAEAFRGEFQARGKETLAQLASIGAAMKSNPENTGLWPNAIAIARGAGLADLAAQMEGIQPDPDALIALGASVPEQTAMQNAATGAGRLAEDIRQFDNPPEPQPTAERRTWLDEYGDWLGTFGGKDTPQNRSAYMRIEEDREIDLARRRAEAGRSGTTVNTAEGVMRYDDDSGSFSRVGGLPPTSRPGSGVAGTDLSLPSDMPSDWRTAVERAILMVPSVRRAPTLSLANRLWSEGRQDELASVVAQAALEGEDVGTQTRVQGRADTVSALEEARRIIQELNASGVDTGLLTGAAEDVARRLGTSTDPRLVEFGTRMDRALNAYTLGMSGVQFSEREAQMYARMFPNYRQSMPVNLASINGLIGAMQVEQENFWNNKLGPSGAQLIGVGQPRQQPGGSSSGTVPMTNDAGETWNVPRDQVETMRANGYRLVN